MRARTACNRAVRRSAAAAVLVVAGGAGLADSGTHTVRAGDTTSEIAAAHGTTVSALAAANGIADADRIIVGQVLVIPGATAAAPATVVHVVAPGETLAVIAGRYATTVAALASSNGIADPNRVRAGVRLTVPAGGGASGAAAAAATTITHTVASGENLAVIASRHGTTVGAIVAANEISNPNLIRVGQRLTITPGAGGTGAVPTTSDAYAATGGADGLTGVGGTHVVAPGDTLAGIARRYGIGAADLAAANGLLPPHTVYAHARYRLDAHNRLPSDIVACPVPGATYVNDWGFPRSGGRAHEGNDLFAARGTAVRAPVGGTVSYATGDIGGKQFRLLAPDGTVYLGSHLDAFGDAGTVSAGATIGYVGSTGNAVGSRPHLHFEVHPDGGVAMNPYPLLRQACG